MTKRRTKVIRTSIFMCGATLALLATTQVTPVNAETTTSENSEVVAKDNTNRIPVESLANAEEYASSLLSTDESVQISNAKITGSTNSITKFDDASEYGMKDGILFCIHISYESYLFSNAMISGSIFFGVVLGA